MKLGVALPVAGDWATPETPIMLAKQLVTLDRVSHGGFGIGWSRDEYEASRTPYERRGKRGDEFIQCLKTIWTSEVAEFQGEVIAGRSI